MHHARWLFLFTLLAIGACSSREPAARQTTQPPPVEPLFEGLGPHTRKVSTASPQAQRYFDQGLMFLYAFNHDEAIRSFQQAGSIDPDCAMAWWGVAMAYGPHINNPMVPPDHEKAAWNAVREARARSSRATATEVAMIDAVATRYADPQPADRKELDLAYANAMRELAHRYPDDPDINALFAEAMMDLRPWDLWKEDGSPQPGTEEIVATLATVIAKNPQHPLALHLYIHAVEASPSPGRADAAADGLRDLAPGLGHLTHMPSHIDVRRGRWQEAIAANEKAIVADDKYRAISPKQGFYGLYMAHNRHMLAYAAMMSGQRTKAVQAMDSIVATMPPGWAEEYAQIADGFLAMPLEVRVRFGLWDEILAAPDFAENFHIARALRHHARGVAYSAKGDSSKARAEQRAFLEAKAAVPEGAVFGNNSAAALLAVAEHMLEGEVAYHEGKTKAGLAALHKAVVAEDALRYDEPPDWILPTRDALGAALLQSRRLAEAEAVFREDLRRLPDNGWGLFGLQRSLELQGKKKEAATVKARFQKVWAKADTPISSPCMCQPGI